MKKALLIMACALTLASCAKKDWNCECTVNGDQYKTTIKKSTKANANSKCGDYGKSVGQQYGTYTYKCSVN